MSEIVSDQKEIAEVAERWKAQYCGRGGATGQDWFWSRIRPAGGSGEVDTEPIYHQLAALGPEATRADVARIIGNDGWIGQSCSECQGVAVIRVGQEPDYDSATAYLCRECLEKAYQLAREAGGSVVLNAAVGD